MGEVTDIYPAGDSGCEHVPRDVTMALGTILNYLDRTYDPAVVATLKRMTIRYAVPAFTSLGEAEEFLRTSTQNIGVSPTTELTPDFVHQVIDNTFDVMVAERENTKKPGTIRRGIRAALRAIGIDTKDAFVTVVGLLAKFLLAAASGGVALQLILDYLRDAAVKKGLDVFAGLVFEEIESEQDKVPPNEANGQRPDIDCWPDEKGS